MAVQDTKAKQALPIGVVTLMFTDIAGSSRLWEEHGDRFIPVWQAHDAILRDAFARWNGYEVKSEGDAFMVAFSDPAAALNCALFVQAALARYPWPTDIGAPRVRVGLHTGEPFVHGNDYFGPAVNRAAHICAAGHGGQVLLSDETLQAIGDRADPKIQFRDMGDFRLKDMGTPQRLHEAQHPSVETRAFPPPRTLEGQPNNLPIQRTTFVGRAREIEQIASYLAHGDKPVLTLTGPSGIGKTRLSLQAAAAKAEWFPDGVWYVKLVEAKDVVGAAIEIAAAMNIPINPAQPPLPQVREWLADRRCLLILDDANTLPQADRLIRDLLSGTTNLRCLATARESLQIAEADELALGGLNTVPEPKRPQIASEAVVAEPEVVTRRALNVPGAPAQPETPAKNETPPADEAVDLLTETDAGHLFLERALAANPKLKLTPVEKAAAIQMIQELDGVPATIERAAQYMDRVPPSFVLEWLNQRLAPDRIPKNAPGVEKFKGILRRSAQRVVNSFEETTKASVVNLGQLLQGIANVATDRRDEKQAAELGRESLRVSQEAGDAMGVAAALRQLARVKWQQGDRQSAAALLSVAVQEYRRHDAEDYHEVLRELEFVREQLEQSEDVLPVIPSVEKAVALAMDESA